MSEDLKDKVPEITEDELKNLQEVFKKAAEDNGQMMKEVEDKMNLLKGYIQSLEQEKQKINASETNILKLAKELDAELKKS